MKESRGRRTGEVEVADAEFGAGDVDGEVDFAAAAEVLDAASRQSGSLHGGEEGCVLAVAAVLGAAGDGPRALVADLLGGRGVGAPGVRAPGLGRERDDAVQLVGCDELALAPVPRLQDLGGRRAAEDARVDEAGELDARDVAGRAVDALEVPDGLGSGAVVSKVSRREGLGSLRRGVVFVEEASAVAALEDAREAPWLVLEGLDVHDLDEQDVAGLGALDLEGTAEVVDLGQVDVEDVVCRVIVADLAAGPAHGG